MDEPWYVVVATLGPLVAALGAIGALIVGILTVRQRTGADARAQWWARVQWAVNLTLEPDEKRRSIGFDALALLASSPLSSPDDDAFLAGLSLDVLDAVQERGAADDVEFVPADAAPPDPAVDGSCHRRGVALRGGGGPAARGDRPRPGQGDTSLDRAAGGDGLTAPTAIDTCH